VSAWCHVPFAAPDCPVVPADLAGSGEPERNGVNLLGAPFLRDIRDLYAATGGGLDIDDIQQPHGSA
jgi:hypothetical protein